MTSLHVRKRDGTLEPFDIAKLKNRIAILAGKKGDNFYRLDVNVARIAEKVEKELYDGVTTEKLGELAVEAAASDRGLGNDYAVLAERIAVSNLHKATSPSMLEVVRTLYWATDPETGAHTPLVSKELLDVVERHAPRIEAAINNNFLRDYNYSYIGAMFGLRMWDLSYLMKIRVLEGGEMISKIVELPQHFLMRIALSMHCTEGKDDIDKALRLYEFTSLHYAIFGSLE